MPAKKATPKKEEFGKNIYLIIVLAIVLGIGLYIVITNLQSFQEPTGLYLECSKASGEQIKCSWKNCELYTGEEKTELVFAKVPDYVKSVEIPTVSGALLFSPSAVPLEGMYTIYISCNNGKVATRVGM